MAKTNPIGVRFKQENLDYLKKEHGVDSPQKALVFYERFFTQHHMLAKDVKVSLREEKIVPPSDDEIKAAGAKRTAIAESKVVLDHMQQKNELEAEIKAIRAETLPEHRKTSLGKASWNFDQNKRVKEILAKIDSLNQLNQ